MKYTLYGRTGLRVSELCLGTMSFGDEWGFGADEDTSHAILDAYEAAGGNFLDTANKYHNGQTETFIGDWLTASQGRRDRTVVATKYTLSMDHDDPNASGNQRKNLMRAIEGSLERLQTDHIDILWVHAWDELTPLDETLRALDDLVSAGNVLYIGISDAPAWVVSASNVMAEASGWNAYAGLQIEYSLLQRTPERDLLPMAQYFGQSVLAWAPLAGGVLTGKYTRGGDNDSLRRQGNDGRGRTSEASLEVARTVDAIADEIGASSAQVATAWVLSRPGCVPIVGARKVSQITDTLGVVDVTLAPEQLERLDAVSRVELGFPHDFLGADYVKNMVYGENARHKIRFRAPRW